MLHMDRLRDPAVQGINVHRDVCSFITKGNAPVSLSTRQTNILTVLLSMKPRVFMLAKRGPAAASDDPAPAATGHTAGARAAVTWRE